MIARIEGKLVEKKNHSVILENNGLFYEVFLPTVALGRLEEARTLDGRLSLVTFHYYHVEPSRSIPVLIGFLNDLEKEFFEIFITVSGIGPKAALRALSLPIPTISQAIDAGDIAVLRSLPGIGPQRAKEIVAKLQGRISRFGLLRCSAPAPSPAPGRCEELADEAVRVLMQLQYKKAEAREMVAQALKSNPATKDMEELLNAVYRHRRTKD
ncbi:MAG: Holliday junction branch migration protein RuvA [Deltaproteobacteria bacterium]